MAYKVIVSPLARLDILEAANYITENGGAERGRSWTAGVLVAIKSLSEMPRRCSVADEAIDVGRELRELHYYSHRIIFSIDEAVNSVNVLRVYHSSRAPLQIDDMD